MPPLRVHDTGDGPALLFLHAFPLDASQWDHQVAAFSGKYRCLRPDMYGFGSSPPPPPGMTLDDYAVAVWEAMDARGVQSCAVIGLSIGGYVALAMLRKGLAARMTALALCDTRAGADSEQARSDRLALAERVRRDGSVAEVEQTYVPRLLSPAAMAEAHILDPVRGRIRRATPAGAAAALEAMAARPDSTPLLASLTVPTLVLVGSQDVATPPSESELLAATIPGARLEVLEGAGHLTNLERWETFNARLATFLDQWAASTPSAGTALGAMQNPS